MQPPHQRPLLTRQNPSPALPVPHQLLPRSCPFLLPAAVMFAVRFALAVRLLQVLLPWWRVLLQAGVQHWQRPELRPRAAAAAQPARAGAQRACSSARLQVHQAKWTITHQCLTSRTCAQCMPS